MDNHFGQGALAAHLLQLEKNIASAPTHILQQVIRDQRIEAHNARIDQQKAERNKLRQVAKQARISLPVLKKMMTRAVKR